MVPPTQPSPPPLVAVILGQLTLWVPVCMLVYHPSLATAAALVGVLAVQLGHAWLASKADQAELTKVVADTKDARERLTRLENKLGR